MRFLECLSVLLGGCVFAQRSACSPNFGGQFTVLHLCTCFEETMVCRLKVVRFRGTVAREYHALAVCIPTESLVRIIYAKHENDCEAQLLWTSMCRACCGSGEKLPEHTQAQTYATIHSCVPHFVSLHVPLTAPLFAAHPQIFEDYDCAGARDSGVDDTWSPLTCQQHRLLEENSRE